MSAASHLRLAHPQRGVAAKTPHEGHPRSFATYYYDGGSYRVADWCARGRAASLRGAVLASVRRLLDRRATAALIHSEDGVVVAQVRWHHGSIHITGVFDHATLQ